MKLHSATLRQTTREPGRCRKFTGGPSTGSHCRRDRHNGSTVARAGHPLNSGARCVRSAGRSARSWASVLRKGGIPRR